MAQLSPENLQQFVGLDLLASQVVEGFLTGLHKSPFHGFSVEFAEHRLYNKGEPIRHIDWKLYARTDKLFVKRYEEETNLRCQFVIDGSSSMFFPLEKLKKRNSLEEYAASNKIRFSTACVAVLMELLKKQRDAAGLSLYTEKIEWQTPAKSSQGHMRNILGELEKWAEENPLTRPHATETVHALHTIAEVLPKRSLVVLFSDFIDQSNNTEALFSALHHLKHKKHEVIVFHVTDKQKELDFNFEDRPYKFVDLETGATLKLNPSGMRDLFRQKATEFSSALKTKCLQHKIDLVEADISAGLHQVLLPYLVKRAKLYAGI